MLHHIELCLDEIECEIEFHLSPSMSEPQRLELKQKIDDLRNFVGALATPALGSRIVETDADASDAISIEERQGDPAVEATPAVGSGNDDLTMIRGIDAATAAMLASRGAATFAAIAAWRTADFDIVCDDEITARRIAQQGWIEQAAILAKGEHTDYARRVQRGEIAALVAMPVPVDSEALAVADLQDSQATVATASAKPAGELVATIEINATKSSFLPPVFEATARTAKPLVVAATADVSVPTAVVEAPEPAPAASDLQEATEDAAEDAAAEVVPAQVVALREAAAPVAKSGWIGRMSLAASLILLLSVGILGLESKLPTSASFLHIVSAD